MPGRAEPPDVPSPTAIEGQGRNTTTELPEFDAVLAGWELPEGPNILSRVEEMIRPALLAGYFGRSTTRFVSGLQYHLGGAQDTQQLAGLADLSSSDRVLDVCCFVGGPALQLADTLGCRVTGVDLDAKAIAGPTRSRPRSQVLNICSSSRSPMPADFPLQTAPLRGSGTNARWNPTSIGWRSSTVCCRPAVDWPSPSSEKRRRTIDGRWRSSHRFSTTSATPSTMLRT